jgi:hypothetical protein
VISVQLSRSAFLDGGVVRPLVVNAIEAATVMARALREQAFNDKRKLTFSRSSRKFLGNEYMAALGSRFQNREGWKRAKRLVHILPEGGWIWASSNAWHETAKKDDASYNRTGGMWRGLKVRNYGPNAAIIEFAGTSIGQEVKYARIGKEYKDGKRRLQVVSKKVPNRLKAYSVFAYRNTNLLEPSAELQRDLADGAHDAVLLWLSKATGADPGTLRAVSKTGREFAAALSPQ